MSGIKISSVLALLTLCLVRVDAKVVITGIKPTTDSYLAALIASKATDLSYNKNRREDNTYPVYNVPGSSSGGSESGSGSGYDYKPPSTNYGGPSPNYGTPTIDSYNPPANSYGGPYHKPSPAYGPPTYAAPVYLPAPPSNYVPYGPPMEENSKGTSIEKWLLEKIKFKVDFYTIGKILLKLVIFKKIVKFIGIICLLLFLPTLKKKLGMGDKDHHSSDESDDESEEERLLKNTNASHISSRKLDDLTLMLTRAIETFAVQGVACADDDSKPECKLSNIFNRLFSIDQSVSVSTSTSTSGPSGESEEVPFFKNAANEVNEV